ncbi:MAG TPA: DUF4136 domain-containing protein [Paucimonas sp.]|nr:DUF4136 domain-containing protein [Paucimonas sp.]
MKYRWLILLATAMTLLSGCAAQKIRSDVTVFAEWPAEMQGAPFTFARNEAQGNDLEYRSYENLVAGELRRLGFVDAGPGRQAKIKVTIGYGINGRDVRIVQPVVIDPFWPHHAYWPYYGPRWRRYYSPFYDPFWHGPPTVAYQESQYELFRRQLKVVLAHADTGKTLYDVTVVSEGRNGSLPAVMPYLVRSAFSEFPSKNGTIRRVELELRE